MKVLLIDNDLPSLEVLSYNLLKLGHMVYTSQDGREGLDLARGTIPDAIVLDFSLPSITGAEVCRLIRRDSDVPIVFLSACANEADQAMGIFMGADRYVVKPYYTQGFLAELESLAETQDPILRYDARLGGVSIEAAAREVRVRGRRVELTTRQLKLLYFLIVRPGRTFTKKELFREVWRKNSDIESDIRNIDTQIRKLREIIERNAAAPKIIHSDKGTGYRAKKDSEK